MPEVAEKTTPVFESAQEIIDKRVSQIIDKTFPKVHCQTPDLDGCRCAGHVFTGKQGRPVTSTFEDFANSYAKPLPSTVTSVINENVQLIAGFIQALADSRRALDETESLYVSTGRDAQAMALIDDEPTQSDVFIRLSVERKELDNGSMETLSQAFTRRAKVAMKVARLEANESRRTLYVFVERYAVERNLRDEPTAKKHGAPLSAVGLMSKNIVTLVITDNEKAYKGLLARVATITPEIVKVPQRDAFGRFLPKA